MLSHPLDTVLRGGHLGPLFFVLMDIAKIKEKILSLALPLVEAQGLEIWGLDVSAPPGRLVRLFVDIPLADLQHNADVVILREQTLLEADNTLPKKSATIEQCEEISRALGLAIEVEDCFDGPWTLEVSTPGLERKFYTLDQLAPYVGDMVELRLAEALPTADGSLPRKTWRGKLLSVDKDGFDLAPASLGKNGEILPEKLPPCHIDWNKTVHIHRLHVFGSQSKPGKSSRKKQIS